MSQIFIPISENKIKSKENINSEFRWYDSIKKEMLFFSGGKLDFEYREDPYLVKMGKEQREKLGIKSTYRLLPKVVNIKINKNIVSSDQLIIEKWFKDYTNYNNSEATIIESSREGIMFDVPESELDYFTYQIERKGLQFSL
jgi:hypothetical protein